MLFDETRKSSLVFRAIETNGQAMGGRDQRARARRRLRTHAGVPLPVAAENPKTRLGLPEVKVGLFPGAGGTQRVPRIVPPQDAMQLLLKGEAVNLEKAKALKLIDAIVPAPISSSRPRTGSRAAARRSRPGMRRTSSCRAARVFQGRHDDVPGRQRHLPPRDYDNYPAARAIMQCVYEGLQLPIDAALRVESRYFTQILRSKEAAAMIRSLFLSMQELNQGCAASAERAADQGEKTRHHRPPVSWAPASAMSRARRHRRDADRSRPGERRQGQGPRPGRDRRPDQEGPRQGKRPRRHPVAHYGDRRLQCIEGLRPHHRSGVRGSKGQGRNLCQGAAAAEPDAIFASNTSTLPITSLAEEFKDQGKFLGIHSSRRSRR